MASSLLIFSFLVQDLAWAAPEIKVNIPMPQMGSSIPVFPREIAAVQDSFRGSSERTVYLLQDAHTNLSAQRNIASTVQYLVEKENLRTVFVEGGFGDVSLTTLKKTSSSQKREEVGMKYLRSGELSGAEYLNLTGVVDFELAGVEDRGLYWKSLELYRTVAKDREKFKDYLINLNRSIDTLKPEVLRPLLRGFDGKRQAFLDGELSFVEYFAALKRYAVWFDVPLSNTPELSKMAALSDAESHIDFKAANAEAIKAARFIEEKNLGWVSAGKLTSRNSQNAEAFYSLLEENLKETKAPVYPELSAYFEYLKKAHSLKPAELLREQGDLEAALLEKLTETPDEKTLLEADDRVRQWQSLINLSLLPNEFQSLLGAETLDLKTLTGFLNKKIEELEDHYDRVIFLNDDFEKALGTAEDFYELTKKRDGLFIERMLARMAEKGETRAILVAGGYHSPNLKAMLREKNISFVCVTPQILNETNIPRYEKLLLGQKPAASAVKADALALMPVKSRSPESAILNGARLSQELSEIAQQDMARASLENAMVVMTSSTTERAFSPDKFSMDLLYSIREFSPKAQLDAIQDKIKEFSKLWHVPYRLFRTDVTAPWMLRVLQSTDRTLKSEGNPFSGARLATLESVAKEVVDALRAETGSQEVDINTASERLSRLTGISDMRLIRSALIDVLSGPASHHGARLAKSERRIYRDRNTVRGAISRAFAEREHDRVADIVTQAVQFVPRPLEGRDITRYIRRLSKDEDPGEAAYRLAWNALYFSPQKWDKKDVKIWIRMLISRQPLRMPHFVLEALRRNIGGIGLKEFKNAVEASFAVGDKADAIYTQNVVYEALNERLLTGLSKKVLRDWDEAYGRALAHREPNGKSAGARLALDETTVERISDHLSAKRTDSFMTGNLAEHDLYQLLAEKLSLKYVVEIGPGANIQPSRGLRRGDAHTVVPVEFVSPGEDTANQWLGIDAASPKGLPMQGADAFVFHLSLPFVAFGAKPRWNDPLSWLRYLRIQRRDRAQQAFKNAHHSLRAGGWTIITLQRNSHRRWSQVWGRFEKLLPEWYKRWAMGNFNPDSYDRVVADLLRAGFEEPLVVHAKPGTSENVLILAKKPETTPRGARLAAGINDADELRRIHDQFINNGRVLSDQDHLDLIGLLRKLGLIPERLKPLIRQAPGAMLTVLEELIPKEGQPIYSAGELERAPAIAAQLGRGSLLHDIRHPANYAKRHGNRLIADDEIQRSKDRANEISLFFNARSMQEPALLMAALTRFIKKNLEANRQMLQKALHQLVAQPKWNQTDAIYLGIALNEVETIQSHIRLWEKSDPDKIESIDDRGDVDNRIRLTLRTLETLMPDMSIKFDPGIRNYGFSLGSLDVRDLFWILVRNAYDARRLDQKLEIEVQTAQIERNGQPHVLFRVKDNGNGMPKAVLDEIRRGNEVSTKGDMGTGKGLAAIREAVQRANVKIGGPVGALEVDSVEGQWTEFRIYLPADIWPEAEVLDLSGARLAEKSFEKTVESSLLYLDQAVKDVNKHLRRSRNEMVRAGLMARSEDLATLRDRLRSAKEATELVSIAAGLRAEYSHLEGPFNLTYVREMVDKAAKELESGARLADRSERLASHAVTLIEFRKLGVKEPGPLVERILSAIVTEMRGRLLTEVVVSDIKFWKGTVGDGNHTAWFFGSSVLKNLLKEFGVITQEEIRSPLDDETIVRSDNFKALGATYALNAAKAAIEAVGVPTDANQLEKIPTDEGPFEGLTFYLRSVGRNQYWTIKTSDALKVLTKHYGLSAREGIKSNEVPMLAKSFEVYARTLSTRSVERRASPVFKAVMDDIRQAIRQLANGNDEDGKLLVGFELPNFPGHKIYPRIDPRSKPRNVWAVDEAAIESMFKSYTEKLAGDENTGARLASGLRPASNGSNIFLYEDDQELGRKMAMRFTELATAALHNKKKTLFTVAIPGKIPEQFHVFLSNPNLFNNLTPQEWAKIHVYVEDEKAPWIQKMPKGRRPKFHKKIFGPEDPFDLTVLGLWENSGEFHKPIFSSQKTLVVVPGQARHQQIQETLQNTGLAWALDTQVEWLASYPATKWPQKSFLRGDGLMATAEYREGTDPDGPIVILVYGVAGRGSWEMQMAKLPAHVTVIALHRTPMPESKVSRTPNEIVSFYAEDVASAVRSITAENSDRSVHVAGHSAGSAYVDAFIAGKGDPYRELAKQIKTSTMASPFIKSTRSHAVLSVIEYLLGQEMRKSGPAPYLIQFLIKSLFGKEALAGGWADQMRISNEVPAFVTQAFAMLRMSVIRFLAKRMKKVLPAVIGNLTQEVDQALKMTEIHPLLRASLRRDFEETAVHELTEELNALLHYRASVPRLAERLKEFGIKSVVVAGRRDVLINRYLAEAFAEAIGANFVLIGGTNAKSTMGGHQPQLIYWQEWNNILMEQVEESGARLASDHWTKIIEDPALYEESHNRDLHLLIHSLFTTNTRLFKIRRMDSQATPLISPIYDFKIRRFKQGVPDHPTREILLGRLYSMWQKHRPNDSLQKIIVSIVEDTVAIRELQRRVRVLYRIRSIPDLVVKYQRRAADHVLGILPHSDKIGRRHIYTDNEIQLETIYQIVKFLRSGDPALSAMVPTKGFLWFHPETMPDKISRRAMNMYVLGYSLHPLIYPSATNHSGDADDSLSVFIPRAHDRLKRANLIDHLIQRLMADGVSRADAKRELRELWKEAAETLSRPEFKTEDYRSLEFKKWTDKREAATRRSSRAGRRYSPEVYDAAMLRDYVRLGGSADDLRPILSTQGARLADAAAVRRLLEKSPENIRGVLLGWDQEGIPNMMVVLRSQEVPFIVSEEQMEFMLRFRSLFAEDVTIQMTAIVLDEAMSLGALMFLVPPKNMPGGTAVNGFDLSRPIIENWNVLARTDKEGWEIEQRLSGLISRFSPSSALDVRRLLLTGHLGMGLGAVFHFVGTHLPSTVLLEGLGPVLSFESAFMTMTALYLNGRRDAFPYLIALGVAVGSAAVYLSGARLATIKVSQEVLARHKKIEAVLNEKSDRLWTPEAISTRTDILPKIIKDHLTLYFYDNPFWDRQLTVSAGPSVKKIASSPRVGSGRSRFDFSEWNSEVAVAEKIFSAFNQAAGSVRAERRRMLTAFLGDEYKLLHETIRRIVDDPEHFEDVRGSEESLSAVFSLLGDMALRWPWDHRGDFEEAVRRALHISDDQEELPQKVTLLTKIAKSRRWQAQEPFMMEISELLIDMAKDTRFTGHRLRKRLQAITALRYLRNGTTVLGELTEDPLSSVSSLAKKQLSLSQKKTAGARMAEESSSLRNFYNKGLLDEFTKRAALGPQHQDMVRLAARAVSEVHHPDAVTRQVIFDVLNLIHDEELKAVWGSDDTEQRLEKIRELAVQIKAHNDFAKTYYSPPDITRTFKKELLSGARLAKKSKLVDTVRYVLKKVGTEGEVSVLMLLKGDPQSPQFNKWEFPGGKKKKKESFEGALAREAVEEINFIPANAKRTGMLEGKPRSPHGPRNVMVFEEVVEGEPEIKLRKGSVEHTEYRWVPVSGLRSPDLPLTSVADLMVTKLFGARLAASSRKLPSYEDIRGIAKSAINGILPSNGRLSVNSNQKWRTRFKDKKGQKYSLEMENGWPVKIYFEDGTSKDFYSIRKKIGQSVMDVHTGRISRVRFKDYYDAVIEMVLDSSGSITLGGGPPLVDGRLSKVRRWATIEKFANRRVLVHVHRGVVTRAEDPISGEVEDFTLIWSRSQKRFVTSFWGALAPEKFNMLTDDHQVSGFMTGNEGEVSIGGEVLVFLGAEHRNKRIDFTEIRKTYTGKTVVVATSVKVLKQIYRTSSKAKNGHSFSKGTLFRAYEKSGPHVYKNGVFLDDEGHPIKSSIILAGLKVSDSGNLITSEAIRFRDGEFKAFRGAEVEVRLDYVNDRHVAAYIWIVKDVDRHPVSIRGKPLILDLSQGPIGFTLRDARQYQDKIRGKRGLFLSMRSAFARAVGDISKDPLVKEAFSEAVYRIADGLGAGEIGRRTVLKLIDDAAAVPRSKILDVLNDAYSVDSGARLASKNEDIERLRARAAEFARQNTDIGALIKEGKIFSSFDEFNRWYLPLKASFRSNEKEQSPAFILLALEESGRLALGHSFSIKFEAGAWNLAQSSPEIREAAAKGLLFNRFDDYLSWYKEHQDALPGAQHTVLALFFAGIIPADRVNHFSQYAGSYHRAVKYKKIIISEMKRILEGGAEGSPLRRIVHEFNPEIFKISPITLRLTLRLAYLEYGHQLVHGGERYSQLRTSAKTYYRENRVFIDAALKRSGEIKDFRQFLKWFTGYRDPAGKAFPARTDGEPVSEGFFIQVLYYGGKISDSQRINFHHASRAFDALVRTKALQQAPEFETSRALIRWYKKNRKDLIPRNADKPLSLSMVVMALPKRSIPDRKRMQFTFDIGAYEYAELSPLFQKAIKAQKRFETFRSLVRWYEGHTDELHSRAGSGQPIQLTYTVRAAVMTGMLTEKNSQAYERLAGVYQKVRDSSFLAALKPERVDTFMKAAQIYITHQDALVTDGGKALSVSQYIQALFALGILPEADQPRYQFEASILTHALRYKDEILRQMKIILAEPDPLNRAIEVRLREEVDPAPFLDTTGKPMRRDSLNKMMRLAYGLYGEEIVSAGARLADSAVEFNTLSEEIRFAAAMRLKEYPELFDGDLGFLKLAVELGQEELLPLYQELGSYFEGMEDRDPWSYSDLTVTKIRALRKKLAQGYERGDSLPKGIITLRSLMKENNISSDNTAFLESIVVKEADGLLKIKVALYDKDGIARALELHKEEIKDKGMGEAAQIAGIAYPRLQRHFREYPENFARFNLKAHVTVVKILEKLGKEKLQGLTPAKAARLYGYDSSNFVRHFNNPKNDGDYDRYGMARPKTKPSGARLADRGMPVPLELRSFVIGTYLAFPERIGLPFAIGSAAPLSFRVDGARLALFEENREILSVEDLPTAVQAWKEARALRKGLEREIGQVGASIRNTQKRIETLFPSDSSSRTGFLEINLAQIRGQVKPEDGVDPFADVTEWLIEVLASRHGNYYLNVYGLSVAEREWVEARVNDRRHFANFVFEKQPGNATVKLHFSSDADAKPVDLGDDEYILRAEGFGTSSMANIVAAVAIAVEAADFYQKGRGLSEDEQMRNLNLSKIPQALADFSVSGDRSSRPSAKDVDAYFKGSMEHAQAWTIKAIGIFVKLSEAIQSALMVEISA